MGEALVTTAMLPKDLGGAPESESSHSLQKRWNEPYASGTDVPHTGTSLRDVCSFCRSSKTFL